MAGTNSVPLPDAVAQARQDVVAAMADLEQIRAAIAAERLPLAADLEHRRVAVADLRAAAAELEAQQADAAARADTLRQDEAEVRAARDQILATLREYRRARDASLGPASAAILAPELAAMDRDLAAAAATGPLFVATSNLLALAERWNNAQSLGLVADGACLDADGKMRSGRFVVVGPAAYFAAAAGGPAGLATARPGSVHPAMFEKITPVARAAIHALAAGQGAAAPVDVTGGMALALAANQPSMWEHLRSGGVIMIPLAVVALAVLLLAAWKWRSLAGQQTAAPEALAAIASLLARDDLAGASAKAQALGAPLRAVALAVVDHWRDPRAALDEVLQERLAAAAVTLESKLAALAVLGGVAPLLGLLGTVTGMIHTFQSLALFGGGQARLLAGGISEALVTTEAGLVIAIPALLLHAWLARRAAAALDRLEQSVATLLDQRPAGAGAP